VSTAAIYARLSQDRDGTKGGTERQLADCRALARREGLEVVEVFSDDDRSAYSGKRRPAFEEMLAQLDRFDAVIYWKMDRLVRRTTQFWKVAEACEQSNTRLVSVLDPVDTSSPIGRGVAGMLASVGEQESYNTSVRVKRMHEENARKGLPHGSRRPFGYEKDGVTVVEAEAKLIREARDRILRGDSLRSIATDWNERGVEPANAKQWHVSGLKALVRGPRIAGLRQHHGVVIGQAVWPAIITPNERERLLAALDGRSFTKRTRGRPPAHLLTGFVQCGRCGVALRSSQQGANGARTWSCLRNPGDSERCGRMSVRADNVDELVEEALLRRLESPSIQKAMHRKPKGIANEPARNLADLEDRIVQLGRDHDEGLISRREWLERRGPLQARLDAARAEVGRDAESMSLRQFAGADVRESWAKLSLDERRSVVALLIDSVTVHPAKPGAAQFDPHRLQIDWRRAAKR